MVFIVLLSVFTCVATTFLIGRIYINFQYLQSNAGYRQLQVMKATRQIVFYNGEDAEKFAGHFHTSLGPIILKLKNYENQLNEDSLPSFNSAGEEGWLFYNQYVRPVTWDLNNNAFIGWFPFVNNVKRLTILWRICKNIEDIVQTVELLRADSAVGETVHIADSKLMIEIESLEHGKFAHLKDKYDRLAKDWLKWRDLVL